MSSVQGFMNPQNEQFLSEMLYENEKRRLGGDLTDKQKERLVKTIRHYMNEVHQTFPGADTAASIRMKNKEVITAVVPDFSAYIRRSQTVTVEADESMRQDIGTRFSQLQNERNPKKPPVPAPPTFRIALDDEAPVSMGIFEQIKKQREEEALRSDELLKARVNADQNYNSMQGAAAAQDQLVLAQRETSRMMVQRESASELASRMVNPDPRRIFMKDVIDGNPVGQGQGTSLETLFRSNNSAAGNPTTALPSAQTTRAVRPQDNIIPQDDILTYKENEYNLFMYSADRDWLSGNPTLQNRYNFTVNFDPGNNRAGQFFGVNAAASIKFKNITRIEFVKAILPVEGIDTIMRKNAATTASINYDVSLNVNILSFPYLNLYVKELDTNSYGTDYNFERAFSVLQYDANWISDNTVTTKGGYLAMIPKFMKCQKVYTPTPLSTLQKLTLRLERPDGNLVSDVQDTLDISGVFSSSGSSGAYMAPFGGAYSANVTGTKYADASANYFWLETANYFSRFSVAQGDRIRIRGVTFPSGFSGDTGALADLVSWLNTGDHLVVGTAWSTRVGSTVYYKDGANQVGYSKYIIIQARMNDPTTGSVLPSNYGSLTTANNATFLSKLCGNTLTAGRLLNLSHQTHFVFRVITRDMDATSRLRPDNL
jgi:hypothetical protein